MTTAGRRARRRHHDRRSLALAGSAVAAILVLAGALLWLASPGPGGIARDDRIGGPFSLVDDRGHAVTEHSFAGKYLVVYFGYTRCRDVCPATLNTLTASLSRLGRKADAVQPLFITLDPEHDTPAALHHFVTGFSARLIGLGGSKAAIDQVADEYRVVRALRPGPAGASDVTIEHSSVLYLIAPDGHFVAPIPSDASEMVIAQVLARYV
jgi:protein SCO1/2